MKMTDAFDNAYDGVKALSKVDIPDCFVAGTLISAVDGYIPIEQIKIGDAVWARDEETGEVALKKAVNTFVNETDKATHVMANGETITQITYRDLNLHIPNGKGG